MSDHENSSSSSSNTELDTTYTYPLAKRPRLVRFSSPVAEVLGASGGDPSPTPVTSSDEERHVAVAEQSETELQEPNSNGNNGAGEQVNRGPYEVHEAPAEVDLVTLHQANMGESSDTVSMGSVPGEFEGTASDTSLAMFSINGMGGSTPSLPSFSSVETIPECLNHTIRPLEESLSAASLLDESQTPDTTGDITTTTSASDSTLGSLISNEQQSPRADEPPQDRPAKKN